MSLTFRAKLMLAMMLLVAGVTGATLYATRDRVQRAYSRLFEDQTLVQFRYFREAREARLEPVEDRCFQLSNNRRLQLLMSSRINPAAETNERDLEGEELLYQTAEDELRVLRSATELGRHTLEAVFFRFLDAGGRMVPPSRGIDAGLKRTARMREALAAQLAGLKGALANTNRTQIGYFPVSRGDDPPELMEVLLTQIIDSVSKEVLGALVMGFPIPASATQGWGIQNGIWQGGRIFSANLDLLVTPTLTSEVGKAAARGEIRGRIYGDWKGVPYLAGFIRLEKSEDFPVAYQISFRSLAEAQMEQERLRRTVLGFGFAGIIASLIISFVLSSGLTGPIEELVRGTRQIQAGNYGHRVPVRSQDEVGQLTESFNGMAQGLADKEHYRSVLDKVTDHAVAEELIGGKIALGGEARVISVIFCDIRGFTKLTENMPPDEVIHMLNEHFTPLTRVVEECHGIVDKFVGDLIMAVFGAPKSYGDDAVNAARCALRMLEERRRLNTSSRYQIEVGIGVATGPAVAGNMGSDRRLNYTVLGERVNLASRLCGQAGRGEIVIDTTTRERLGPDGETETLPEVALKGFSSKMQIYKLRGLRSLSPRQ
ncbi:MAG TPA: adenylate/guanylate cyclase domain-containing protein [Verrucomicrobiae bacterium]|nr:adenylate/guanylate cyclase domain-containing protein [Verrucomicrobiae bacterium]